MDTKKKMTALAALMMSLMSSLTLYSQDVDTIEFCGRGGCDYGKDSIIIYCNALDESGEKIRDIPEDTFRDRLRICEDGDFIDSSRYGISSLTTGQRIPDDYTFSVLVDQSMPQDALSMIYDAVGMLVGSAADSSVYISSFGSEVASTVLADRYSYGDLEDVFVHKSDKKDLYGAVYAKIEEFNAVDGRCDGLVSKEEGYSRNDAISLRAGDNSDRNILLIFTRGDRRSDDYADMISKDVTDYVQELVVSGTMPKVYVFYYMTAGKRPANSSFYDNLCDPKMNTTHFFGEPGRYMASSDMNVVVDSFKEVVNDRLYDYAFSYKVNRQYRGERIHYTASWDGESAGEWYCSIGSVERPWPEAVEDAGDKVAKYLLAFLITVLGILFFYVCTKIILPLIRFRAFSIRYYRRYRPEINVKRRICPYCREPLEEGQMVVEKCQHTMHAACWKENGYRCVEYGQNCTTGIQTSVEWSSLFTKSSYGDCYQTITGILAGFVSWVIYELSGRGLFEKFSSALVGIFYSVPENGTGHFQDAVAFISAVLTIGACLGFFLSVTFRANDEYRSKNWKIWLKILSLSLLTGIIGMASFAFGGIIYCRFLSACVLPYIPWYFAAPGYIIFAICVSLGLTVKSTIPTRSAVIGGAAASVIGFMVLYFVHIPDSRHVWMPMLLDFILFSGGLGASLVTVRLLAEKYYLVIQNGVKANQRIPIHKWMNATGGGKKVTIGMTSDCEIQMNWEKSNKVAKEHAQLYIDYEKKLPMIKPLSGGMVFNNRGEMPVNRPMVLSNGDTVRIGDTIFKYVETN